MRPPKRFIKKVPPSGAAPVFKLTLPHRVVHTHLSHLIDTEFEIATSATATHSWQGTIAPRRNKDRSEYTLQGWRLFAEAHRVQPGDQVSFELVTPRRLVVQVISTEDTKLAARSNYSNAAMSSPMQDGDSSPRAASAMNAQNPAEQADAAGNPLWPGVGLAAAAVAAGRSGGEGPQDAAAAASQRPTGSGESSSQVDVERQMDQAGPSCLQLSPTTPRAHLNAPGQQPDSTVTSSAMRPLALDLHPTGRHASWPAAGSSLNGMSQRFRQLAQQNAQPDTPSAGAHTPSANPRLSAAEEETGSKGTPSSRAGNAAAAAASNTQLNFQLRNLTSTIQALQADLHLFESRAHKAEFEATQLKLIFGEVRVTLDRQSRAVLQAGEALEKLASKLAAPSLLAAADQPFADKVLSLQTEMFGCVDKLKSSLLHLMSIEI